MSILPRVAVLCLGFLVLPIVASADADTTTFKVSSYIPTIFRDLQWSVTGQADLNGDGGHDYNAPGDKQYSTRNSSRSRNLQAGTDWRKTYVTRPLSWNFGILADIDYGRGSTDSRTDEINLLRENHSQDSISGSTVNYDLRLFGTINSYVAGDLFLSLSSDMYANINRTYNVVSDGYQHLVDSSYGDVVYKRDWESHSDRNNTTEEYRYYVTMGAGWGRVYYGNYAATALYMIDELKNHGQLKGLPDRSVMDSLTELIYQYRKSHAVDNRLRRIEALGAITSYLRSKGITDMSDPVAGVYLQDVWDYFPSDSRKFGFIMQLSAGVSDSRVWHGSGQTTSSWDSYYVRAVNSDSIVDSITYQSTYSTESHGSMRSNSPVITASVSYFCPVSLRTQFNAIATGSYYLDPTDKVSYSTRIREHNYYATIDLGLDYIFSSRTRAQLVALARYSTVQEVLLPSPLPVPDYNRSRDDLGQYRLSASLQYRIAIPTTLTGTVSYDARKENYRAYYENISPRSAAHYYSLSIRITHYLY